MNFARVPPGLESKSVCSFGDPQGRGLSLPGDRLARGWLEEEGLHEPRGGIVCPDTHSSRLHSLSDLLS